MDWDAIGRTVVEHLAPPVLTILAGVLLTLGNVAIARLAKRFGLESTEKLDAAWQRIVDGGIAYAEQRAKRYANGRSGGGKAPSTAKLDWALGWAIERAKEQGLPKLARERIEQRIESRLGTPDSPDKRKEDR